MKTSKLQTKLIIIFSIIIIFTAGIIGISTYRVSKKIVEHEIGNSRLEVLEQISNNIQIIIKSIQSISNIYYFNDDLLYIMNSSFPTNKYERLLETEDVIEILSKNSYSFNSMELDYYSLVYSFNEKVFSSWLTKPYKFNTIPKRMWYNDIIEKDGKILWIPTYNDKEGYGENKYVFAAARLLKYNYCEKPLGILIMNIDEQVLYKTYKNIITSNNNVYIIDKNGNVVSSNNKELLSINILNKKYIRDIIDSKLGKYFIIKKNGSKEKYLIISHKIEEVDWIIIQEVPLKIVFEPLYNIKKIILLVFVITVLGGMAISYLISTKVSKPVKTLYNHMKEVEEGNLNVSVNINSKDEIGELSIVFNHLVTRIKELIKDVKVNEERKRKTEIDFLQAQINPHFLYNTIASIRFKVALGENKEANNMLKTFVRLLRKTIGIKEEIITIREEIDGLKEYTLLNKYRYSNKIKFEIDIEENMLYYKIPKLILQPIVENAIFHGLEPNGGEGSVIIKGRIKNEKCVFNIIDNGIGMSTENIQNIWEKSNMKMDKKTSSIGIRNVHERIVLHYGEKYGVEIYSKLKEGTVIEISFPIIL